jgi:hypothetical protein
MTWTDTWHFLPYRSSSLALMHLVNIKKKGKEKGKKENKSSIIIKEEQ